MVGPAQREARVGRWLIAAALMIAPALALAVNPGEGPRGPLKNAADGRNPIVDRLSVRLERSLVGGEAPDGYRAPVPERGRRGAATVVAAELAAADPADPEVPRITLTVQVPPDGPRLLLVDAGPTFFTRRGEAFVLRPNQRAVVWPPESTVTFAALPLDPEQRPRPAGLGLRVALAQDPALIGVLRAVQRIEAGDAQRLTRYLDQDGDRWVVKTFVRNEDTRVAGWMNWSTGPDGKPQGRLPLDAVRFALYAVAPGYRIHDVADYLRLKRKMDLEPAIAAAREIAQQAEFIIERAGLDHRVFGPQHAEYHYNRAHAAFDAGDLERAEALFRKAISMRTEMVEAHFNLGVTLYRAGKYQAAADALLIASGIAGAPADVWYNRGAALYRAGDLLGAARQFRAALEKQPEHADAKAWLEKADPEGKTAPPPPKKKKKRRRRRRRK